ncbi:MAG: hypothetical protein ACP5OZ_04700 [Candidatus Woesearchaeota archaeon]
MKANKEKDENEKQTSENKIKQSNNKIKPKTKKEFLIALAILAIALMVYFLFFSNARIIGNEKRNQGTEIPIVSYSQEKAQEQQENPSMNEVNAII